MKNMVEERCKNTYNLHFARWRIVSLPDNINGGIMQTQTKKMSRAQLIFLFLKGSKRYYLLAVLGSMMVSLMEMITPQIIRLTVDSVLGSEPLNVPDYLRAAVSWLGGVDVLRANLILLAAGVVCAVLALRRGKGGSCCGDCTRCGRNCEK